MAGIISMIDWKIVYHAFLSYFSGIYGMVVMYIVALLFFLFTADKKITESFVYPFMVAILTIYNPVVLSVITHVIDLSSRIRRVFWLLPLNLVIAYGIVQLVVKCRKRIFGILICIIFAVIVIVVGTPVSKDWKLTDNRYKISSEIIALDQIIKNDAAGDSSVIVYSDVELLQIREYDPSLRSVLGRYELREWEEPDLDAVLENGSDSQIIALVERFDKPVEGERYDHAVKKQQVDYIIQKSADVAKRDYYEGLGYRYVDTTGYYVVYAVQ